MAARRITILLGVLALLACVLGITLMIRGAPMDQYNGLFVYAAILGAFTALLQVMNRSLTALPLEDRERLLEEARRESYLHPDHTVHRRDANLF